MKPKAVFVVKVFGPSGIFGPATRTQIGLHHRDCAILPNSLRADCDCHRPRAAPADAKIGDRL